MDAGYLPQLHDPSQEMAHIRPKPRLKRDRAHHKPMCGLLGRVVRQWSGQLYS